MVGRGVRHAGWRFTRWLKRHHGMVGTLAAVTAVLVTLMAYWIWPPKQAEPPQRPPRTGIDVVPELNPIRQAGRTGFGLQTRTFMFDRPPAELSPPPRPLDPDTDPDAVFDWLYDNGGADIGTTYLEIAVVGIRTKSVVLTDFRIRAERRPAMAGHLVTVKPRPGGEGIGGRWIYVDLDHDPPRIELTDEDNIRNHHWSFPLRVSSAEPEYFMVQAGTRTCDCSWTAELHYIADGKARVHRIDNNGKPFRTTGRSNAVARYVTPDGRSFEEIRASG